MWYRLQAVSKSEPGWCNARMQLLGVDVLLLQDTYKSLLARYVLFTVLFTGICCILRATRGAHNPNLQLSIKHVRALHVSNQQRILPRMKEKFAILLSTFGPSSTFSLLSCEICAKHSVGTRPFGLPIDSHTLLVRLGQVKTIKIYLLLRVPECAAFLFYSFSMIHQAQSLPVQWK